MTIAAPVLALGMVALALLNLNAGAQRAIQGLGDAQAIKSGVIGNWKDRIGNVPRCRIFKDRFEQLGRRHDGTANGRFATETAELWKEVKAAGCDVRR